MVLTNRSATPMRRRCRPGGLHVPLHLSAPALAMLAGISAATDLPASVVVPPAPVMTAPTSIAFNWTGYYVGAHGGYSFVDGPDINDGYEIGGQTGVNTQYGQFVLGIEVDGGFVDWGPVTAAGSVRARAGYAFKRFLPYVTGGMGIEDSIGWTVGAGVDYALADRWSIGVDYLHHDFIGGHSAEMIRGRVNHLFNTVGGI